MSRGTPNRNVRVPDNIWDPALRIAQARGETLSDVIREALTEYIAIYSKDKKC
ncbi:hypothetical protein [Gordonia tangerina]|uniref:Ribbon-helix-helix protein CopG domain-containing protein n=1 Tax=Gordonia tangerina TaxID=2911060 RepID=A0ABS9DL91_9ACTN|nr:hypothetical protein [Gordonia tangerina]MCF3939917.1 hypothetical protein [Gordonia tangerina]